MKLKNLNATESSKSELTDDQNIQVNNIIPEITPPKELAKPEEELETHRVTTKSDVPPEEPTVTVDSIGIFSKQNIHAIKGKQKQGKTTALKVIVSAILLVANGLFRLKSYLTNPKIIWLDTEQCIADVKLILTDIMHMTGLDSEFIDEHLRLYSLRTKTYKTLLDDLLWYIQKHRPDVVIIDGVVQFVQSFNDEEKSNKLIRTLMKIAQEFNCAIINVLHTNKTEDDHGMRGHLGTMLSQAASTVVECSMNAGVITIKSTDSRHVPMPEWSIMFTPDGSIVDAEKQRRLMRLEQDKKQYERNKAKTEKTNNERMQAAAEIVRKNGGSISSQELVELLKERISKGDSTAKAVIKMCTDASLLSRLNGMISIVESQPETA